MESCTIGTHCDRADECHKTTYSNKIGFKKLSELPADDSILLLRRCNIADPVPDATVCYHHEQIYLERYIFLQKSCCDPYKVHSSSRRKSLRPMDTETADKVNKLSRSIVHPGQKLCPDCRKKVDYRFK